MTDRIVSKKRQIIIKGLKYAEEKKQKKLKLWQTRPQEDITSFIVSNGSAEVVSKGEFQSVSMKSSSNTVKTISAV
jgi:pyridoxine/pyridoxamine 5'-phosphate oxidase